MSPRPMSPRPMSPGLMSPGLMSPIVLEFSVFRKLPPELLMYIGSFLLPESALSFSLCCQSIYFTIGKQYLDTLKENSIRSDHRYMFLKLLERDLPDHTLCYHVLEARPKSELQIEGFTK
jgi:hypothetical protein